MNYLLTIKDGTEVLGQQTMESLGLIQLIKQLMMEMGDLDEKEYDIKVMSFIQQVEEVGAQSIENKHNGHKLIVQMMEEEIDG